MKNFLILGAGVFHLWLWCWPEGCVSLCQLSGAVCPHVSFLLPWGDGHKELVEMS